MTTRAKIKLQKRKLQTLEEEQMMVWERVLSSQTIRWGVLSQQVIELECTERNYITQGSVEGVLRIFLLQQKKLFRHENNYRSEVIKQETEHLKSISPAFIAVTVSNMEAVARQYIVKEEDLVVLSTVSDHNIRIRGIAPVVFLISSTLSRLAAKRCLIRRQLLAVQQEQFRIRKESVFDFHHQNLISFSQSAVSVSISIFARAQLCCYDIAAAYYVTQQSTLIAYLQLLKLEASARIELSNNCDAHFHWIKCLMNPQHAVISERQLRYQIEQRSQIWFLERVGMRDFLEKRSERRKFEHFEGARRGLLNKEFIDSLTKIKLAAGIELDGCAGLTIARITRGGLCRMRKRRNLQQRVLTDFLEDVVELKAHIQHTAMSIHVSSLLVNLSSLESHHRREIGIKLQRFQLICIDACFEPEGRAYLQEKAFSIPAPSMEAQQRSHIWNSEISCRNNFKILFSQNRLFVTEASERSNEFAFFSGILNRKYRQVRLELNELFGRSRVCNWYDKQCAVIGWHTLIGVIEIEETLCRRSDVCRQQQIIVSFLKKALIGEEGGLRKRIRGDEDEELFIKGTQERIRRLSILASEQARIEQEILELKATYKRIALAIVEETYFLNEIAFIELTISVSRTNIVFEYQQQQQYYVSDFALVTHSQSEERVRNQLCLSESTSQSNLVHCHVNQITAIFLAMHSDEKLSFCHTEQENRIKIIYQCDLIFELVSGCWELWTRYCAAHSRLLSSHNGFISIAKQQLRDKLISKADLQHNIWDLKTLEFSFRGTILCQQQHQFKLIAWSEKESLERVLICLFESHLRDGCFMSIGTFHTGLLRLNSLLIPLYRVWHYKRSSEFAVWNRAQLATAHERVATLRAVREFKKTECEELELLQHSALLLGRKFRSRYNV